MNVAIDIYPLKSGHQYRGIGKNTENLINALGIYYPEIQIITEGTSGADIVHYTHFDLFFHTLPIRKPKPAIVTVHDVIPLIYPKEFPVGLRGHVHFFLQRLALANAKAIITISEQSKNDIIKYLGVTDEKIHVRYLAPHDRFRKLPINSTVGVKEKYHLPDRFILYVGDINYNKNVPGLIRAFNQVKNADLFLVLVGKAFNSRGIKEITAIDEAIARGNKQDKILMPGFIPDDDLVSFYNLARAVVLPSFYEGFGYQVVEGFACGTPVISSPKASLGEIIGNAAYVIDPQDLASITQGIERIAVDDELCQALVRLGFEQVKQFNQKKYAQETVKVYQEVYDRYCRKAV